MKRSSALSRTKPLKRRTKQRRQLTPMQMHDLTERSMLRDGRCAYADWLVRIRKEIDGELLTIQTVKECNGATTFDHWIEQAWIRNHFTDPIDGTDNEAISAALLDLRMGKATCAEHHALRHSGQLLIPVQELTNPEFLDAVEEHGVEALEERFQVDNQRSYEIGGGA